MSKQFNNPFSLTRAADLTDAQIAEYWVDIGDSDGFTSLVKPTLEMPMFVLGGKGSGKTHIMRYLSFELQRIRHGEALLEGVQEEGYLGIYMRCSGLNSRRFGGKRQEADVWAGLFAYYMELWLAQMTLRTACEVLGSDGVELGEDSTALRQIMGLFDDPQEPSPRSLSGLSEYLRELQRELDVAINNCGIRGRLDVVIRSTTGRLIFGIPRVLAEHFPQLKTILFVYLIDEYENLTESQQKLINTFVREREAPCSFKIGSKLFGVRTHSTYSANEDNREGSEYEVLPLDSHLRESDQQYSTFAARVIVSRLVSKGHLPNPPSTDKEKIRFLQSAFQRIENEDLALLSTKFVLEKYKGKERPYFTELRKQLTDGAASNSAVGVETSGDIDAIVKLLSCPDVPLLEKLNCFMLYQKWSSRKDLSSAAFEIQRECSEYLRTRDKTSAYHDKLLHWKSDMLAQLRKECSKKQLYAGFATIVDLSWGNPRHLLIILKHVVSWAGFKGEYPFTESAISVRAQSDGVRKAADWFFSDARTTGRDGQCVQDAINRFGTLLRSIRYAHKPSECSVSSFSFDSSAVTENATHYIDLASKLLLIIPAGDQRDRNSKRMDKKFQLNRMLAPKWDVSSSLRGVLSLNAEEVNSIFDPAFAPEFEGLLARRVERMTAPHFGVKPRRSAIASEDQQTLPGLDND